jgi:hypothetical protein
MRGANEMIWRMGKGGFPSPPRVSRPKETFDIAKRGLGYERVLNEGKLAYIKLNIPPLPRLGRASQAL